MRLKSRIDGLDRLGRALGAATASQALAAELRVAADDIRERAAAALADGAPPDSRTGALAASLQVRATPDGSGFEIGTPLDYGWHLEHGSRSRPAFPWLAPAAEVARPAFLARMRGALNAALAAALGRGR